MEVILCDTKIVVRQQSSIATSTAPDVTQDDNIHENVREVKEFRVSSLSSAERRRFAMTIV